MQDPMRADDEVFGGCRCSAGYACLLLAKRLQRGSRCGAPIPGSQVL